MAKRNEFYAERVEFAKFHNTAEKELLPYFRKAIQASIQPVINWVNTFGTENVPVDKLIKRDVWAIVYPNVYQLIGLRMARKEYFRQRKLEGIEQKASVTDFFKDVWSGKLKDYAANYAKYIQEELNNTTIELLKRALGDDAILELDSMGRVRFFLQKIKGLMQTRTENISRTEATSISNLGKEIGARTWIDENGGEGFKMWLGRNDERERPAHLRENNTIIPIDDYYVLDGFEAERPGDVRLPGNLRIMCRCTQSIMSQNRYNALQRAGRIVGGRVIDAI